MHIAIYGKFPTMEEDKKNVVLLLRQLLKIYPSILVWSKFFDKIKSFLVSVKGIEVFNCKEDLKDRADILLSLGGDGTMLDTVDYVIGTDIAVLGVNLGHLGFLTSVGRDDIKFLAQELEKNNFTIEKRQLLEIETSDNDMTNSKRYGANEACFLSSERGNILDLEVFVNNRYLTTFSGDGVLIATPTGSTAYSLSCNGPIITPEAECICITPVSPHNLTFRPIILSSEDMIKVHIPVSNNACKMLMDGYSIFEETKGDVIIRSAAYSWNLLRFEKQDFFDAIRKKLMWGTTPEYITTKRIKSYIQQQ